MVTHRTAQWIATGEYSALTIFRKGAAFALLTALIGCSPIAEKSQAPSPTPEHTTPATTRIDILDESARALLNPDTPVETLASGFEWTEGPLWIEDGQYLLFSDIPNNRILKYRESGGVQPYLEPSGATGLQPHDYTGGSNGLLLNDNQYLILLQQGDRRVARMRAPVSEPSPQFETLAAQYQGQRLNSPNDGVFNSSGDLYFTDPAYGLNGGLDDPQKELGFQGIYRLSASGSLRLLDDTVVHPNGIALSPDQKTLYVGVSSKNHPRWLAYDVTASGDITQKRILYDASWTKGKPDYAGVPDGMAVHSSGYIFATGPGGVWVFTPKGEPIARIFTGRLTANCALNADETQLYITAHDTLMRVSLKRAP